MYIFYKDNTVTPSSSIINNHLEREIASSMLQYPHWYIKHFPMKTQNLSSLPLTVFSTNILGFSLRLKLLYVEFSFAISLLLEILISRNLCNSKILVLEVRLYMNCIHPIGIATEII